MDKLRIEQINGGERIPTASEKTLLSSLESNNADAVIQDITTNGYVGLNSDQEIGGHKVFSEPVDVPSSYDDSHAVNRGDVTEYVDNKLAEAGVVSMAGTFGTASATYGEDLPVQAAVGTIATMIATEPYYSETSQVIYYPQERAIKTNTNWVRYVPDGAVNKSEYKCYDYDPLVEGTLEVFDIVVKVDYKAFTRYSGDDTPIGGIISRRVGPAYDVVNHGLIRWNEIDTEHPENNPLPQDKWAIVDPDTPYKLKLVDTLNAGDVYLGFTMEWGLMVDIRQPRPLTEDDLASFNLAKQSDIPTEQDIADMGFAKSADLIRSKQIPIATWTPDANSSASMATVGEIDNQMAFAPSGTSSFMSDIVMVPSDASDLTIQFGVLADGTSAGVTRWNITFSIIPVNGIMDGYFNDRSRDLSVNMTDVSGEVRMGSTILSDTYFPEGTMFYVKLSRLGSDALDTNTNNAIVPYVLLKYNQ